MKSIGKTIKEIRKMKGMRQQDFTGLSQGAIAKIEGSNRNISMDKLLSILNDFKMTLREFEYIRNGFALSPADKMFYRHIDIKSSVYLSKEVNNLREFKDYLKENPSDFIIYCLYILEDVYMKINTENSMDIHSPEALEIWQTLDTREGWTYQETFIMSKLFFAFPSIIASRVISRIEREMNKYLEFFKEPHFDLAFYINLGKYYTHKRGFKEAKHYLKKTIPLAVSYDNPVIENDAYAHLAIIDYLEGDKEAEKVVLDCVKRYEAMRRPVLAEDLLSDWETIFKKS